MKLPINVKPSSVKKLTEGEEEGGRGEGEEGEGGKNLNCNTTKLLKKLDNKHLQCTKNG